MSIKKNSQSRVAALKPFWRASAYDYLILVLALFLFIGAFHLHVALTVRAPPDQRPAGLEA